RKCADISRADAGRGRKWRQSRVSRQRGEFRLLEKSPEQKPPRARGREFRRAEGDPRDQRLSQTERRNCRAFLPVQRRAVSDSGRQLAELLRECCYATR